MATPCASFEEGARCPHTHARRGTLTLPHGTVQTPAFMAVGTYGAVKGLEPRDLQGLGAQIVLSNTFHLHIAPGDERIRDLGGLHRFMGWPGPILTDSGGFQVFSLTDLRRVDDDGVDFRSPRDGRMLRLTPDSVLDIQRNLGVDIAMILDECLPADATRPEVERSLRRTVDWARKASAWMERRGTDRPAAFGIVQGGFFDDLRRRCLEQLAELPFEGLALGGMSVGEPREVMHHVFHEMGHRFPTDRPRYVMGVGYPIDIIEAVAAGFDMFDCVLPTRNARNGQMFTSRGRINIKNARWKDEAGPVDPECDCPTCRTYPAAYLRHLFVTKHPLASRLMTVHNLHFYYRLMARIRATIADGTFPELLRKHREGVISDRT